MKKHWPALTAAGGFLLFVLNGFLESGSSGAREVLHVVLAWVAFAMIVVGLGAMVLRSSMGPALRILSGLLLLFVLGLCFVSYCYGIALRNAALLSGRIDLRQAKIDYEQSGNITNYSRGSKLWLSSNVVSIAGVPHECFLTVKSDRFNNEGVLAMTTNEVFIWLDAKRGPKIIGHNYRPPFFPPRF